MPEIPTDTSDDAIRNRLFELMPKYPSKDACKMHLRAEGYPAEHVERVVEETFELRKKVVNNRFNDKLQKTRVLVSILDGETALPQDVEKLEDVARDYSYRLAKDIRYDKAILYSGAALFVCTVLVTVVLPNVWTAIAKRLAFRPIEAFLTVSGVIFGMGNCVAAVYRLKHHRERMHALKKIAHEQRWDGIAG